MRDKTCVSIEPASSQHGIWHVRIGMRRAPEVLKYAYLGKSSGTYHLPLVRPFVCLCLALSRSSPPRAWLYRLENWPVNRSYHGLYTCESNYRYNRGRCRSRVRAEESRSDGERKRGGYRLWNIYLFAPFYSLISWREISLGK